MKKKCCIIMSIILGIGIIVSIVVLIKQFLCFDEFMKNMSDSFEDEDDELTYHDVFGASDDDFEVEDLDLQEP